MRLGESTTSHADLAYERVRGLIRDGTYHPGSLLSEYTVAKQIGLGRTPLREAISRLVYEGLLSRLPGRGVLVNTLTARDISEQYEVLEWLEIMCVRRGASEFSDQEIAELNDILSHAAEKVAEGVSWEGYREFDHAFHSALWAGARNTRALRLLSSTYEAVILDPWTREIADIPEQCARSIAEHRQIVAALEARDPSAGEAAVRQHSQSYRRALATRIFGPLWEDRAQP